MKESQSIDRENCRQENNTGQEESRESSKSWFVLRDLTRVNCKTPAYKVLEGLKYEVFTPMREKLIVKNGRSERVMVPFLHDLVFCHAEKERLDTVVKKYPTIQYRYQKGGGYCCPMVVKESDMDSFIRVASQQKTVRYFLAEQIKEDMIGKKVRIAGGTLDGCQGNLIEIEQGRKKRLIVTLPSLLSVSVEIGSGYIEII